MSKIRMIALITALLTAFSGLCACGENAAGPEENPANGTVQEEYTPAAPFPDILGILRRTAAEYGKPSKIPKRFNRPTRFNNTTFYLDTIRIAEYVVMTARDPDGKKNEKVSFIRGRSDGAFVTKMLKEGSNLLTLYDYSPEKEPFTRERFSETFLIMKNAVRNNEYTIRSPMKKEQIPGWSSESFRSRRYGGDGTILGCGTTLVGDTETLSVEALFDQEGRTVGYIASRTPKDGYETRWEGDAAGRVTCFRAGRDGDASMLREMNDRIDLPLYQRFRAAVTDKYPALFDENGTLKDPEVRLYCLSMTDDRELCGDQVYAVRGELMQWNPGGGLRLETEAQDADGNRVDLMGLENAESLRDCAMVTIEPGEEPTAEPTEVPTAEPTAEPTEEPRAEPTAEPTEEPTNVPTV